jgi:hypothetical protein
MTKMENILKDMSLNSIIVKQTNDSPFHDVYLFSTAQKTNIGGRWTEVHCTNNSCIIVQQDLPTEYLDIVGCHTADWVAP